jgi:hypothetical protein
MNNERKTNKVIYIFIGAVVVSMAIFYIGKFILDTNTRNNGQVFTAEVVSIAERQYTDSDNTYQSKYRIEFSVTSPVSMKGKTFSQEFNPREKERYSIGKKVSGHYKKLKNSYYYVIE